MDLKHIFILFHRVSDSDLVYTSNKECNFIADIMLSDIVYPRNQLRNLVVIKALGLEGRMVIRKKFNLGHKSLPGQHT